MNAATLPRPDFAIGYPVLTLPRDSTLAFSSDVLSLISGEADFNLQPFTRAVDLGTGAAFPAFVHESTRASGDQVEVVNQLAKSFIWMLHQQDELRKAALEGDVNASQSQLPVFGIASVGPNVTVYSAVGTHDLGFVSQKGACTYRANL